MAPHCRVPSLTHLHAPHFTKTVFPWAQQTEHLSTFNFRVQSKHVTQPLSSATGQTRDTTCFFDYRRNMWRNSILQPQILWLETIGVPMVIFGVPMVIFLNWFFFSVENLFNQVFNRKACSSENLNLNKITFLLKTRFEQNDFSVEKLKLFCWKIETVLLKTGNKKICSKWVFNRISFFFK